MISNADGKIWIALRNRLQQWSECALYMPEEIYAPESTDTFIITQHVTTQYGGVLPVQIECGQPLSGFLNLSIMQPVDMGYDRHIGMAGRVGDFFPNGASYQYQDITVRINGRSRVLGNATLNTSWNRLEVQVSWIAWG